MLKKGLYTVGIIIIVVLAYYIGTSAGEYFQQKKMLERRASSAKHLSKQMDNIEVGSTIPNSYLENLQFKEVQLQSVITNTPTIILFLEPNCPSCIEDITTITSNLSKEILAKHFLIISSGNPRQLIDLIDEFKLTIPILYDHNKGYSNIFRLNIFPFHIIVDENLMIKEIINGQLIEDDLYRLINVR